MKWAKSRRHTDNYYCWRDLLHVMLVTLCICLVVALVIALLLVIMNPRVATAGDITNFRKERRLAAVVIPSEKVTTRASESMKTVWLMELSAYSPTVAQTDGAPLTMASGQKVRVGAIASDWTLLPEGSLVRVKGYNNGQPCVCLDTGGMIKGRKLDLFFWEESDAIKFGRRKNIPVEILRIGW